MEIPTTQNSPRRLISYQPRAFRITIEYNSGRPQWCTAAPSLGPLRQESLASLALDAFSSVAKVTLRLAYEH
jgi:hypothetical protein